MRTVRFVSCIALGIAFGCHGADGKLLATPGVSQVEGSGGGGLVPWAQLAGYASRDEVAANAFCSHAGVDDYRLNVCGIQANFYDRVELSFAQQKFAVDALNTDIEQQITGVKLRLYGDLVYSSWPQISVGMQHKSLEDASIAGLLGAQRGSGNDVYLAASKLMLGGASGYNWFWNLTARYSGANQLGLLGYGGFNGNRQWRMEGSIAVFISPSWAVGAEFRDKNDNLGLKEQAWKDIFVAWFPNKSFSTTLAWLDLGRIAGVPGQTGVYLSFTGYW